jgi:hypothetical protein
LQAAGSRRYNRTGELVGDRVEAEARGVSKSAISEDLHRTDPRGAQRDAAPSSLVACLGVLAQLLGLGAGRQLLQ